MQLKENYKGYSSDNRKTRDFIKCNIDMIDTWKHVHGTYNKNRYIYIYICVQNKYKDDIISLYYKILDLF